ncbi:MAG TPA: ABC transporter permease [Polyangiaceae bacterium]|nr:ABC transporter permease [Polyangiaceae bacterium]
MSFFAMLWSTFVMALRELRRNVLRSVLTTLGIVIGVAAVVALVTLGEGATRKVTQDISNMGVNMLTLFPGAERRGPTSVTSPPLTLDDVRAIEREIPSVAAVAPASSSTTLAINGNANWNTQVTGSTNEYFVVRGLGLRAGRTFSDVELQGGAPACVLGATVERELFGQQSPLGQTIRIGRLSCVVVGTLVPKGQSTFGMDQDDFVLVPLKSFQRRIAGNANVGNIAVSAVSEAATKKAKSQIETLMRERRRIAPGQADDFQVRDMQEVAQTLQSVTGALTLLLGAVAAVSLIVGGIGIMNIMLVSVTERTREIGTRLAIGARGREVLLQFIVEAVVLSTLGGIMGIALGLGGSFLATRAFGMPFVFLPGIVAVAFSFSAFVGVGFGYLPAHKAARLNPIEALRHE